VLAELSVTIQRGESMLLLGPSGSGKSTLLQVLAGIIPRSIEAWFTGEVTRPERVGVMFQDPDAQFCMLTVEDEIAFSLENRSVPPEVMPERIAQLMQQVRLEVAKETPINQLSGGLKQRLALACLLALEPEVLFFDEPTAQLDPVNTAQVLADIRALQGHHTLLLIEHKLDGVIDWVDRVLLFGPDGRIEADGPPRDILREHRATMERYGIWQPKLWPLTWADVLEGRAPEQAEELERQFAAYAGRGSEAASAGTPVLRVHEAGLRYALGRRKAGEPVWTDVELEVQAGEWVAVVGPNGAGKSSFLKAVGGLHKLSAGRVEWKGRDLTKWKAESLYDEIGFVFQNPEHQFIADTVFEEVAFGGKLARWEAGRIQRETEQLLVDFQLQALQTKNPFTLSQGQKRRLSVAGMLLKQQELLLLDEPTFGQDAATTRELLDRLQERNASGTTIMMATHDMDIVAAYATRVVVFAEGGVLFDGSPHALFQQPDLLRRASLTAPLPYEYKQRRAQKAGALHV